MKVLVRDSMKCRWQDERDWSNKNLRTCIWVFQKLIVKNRLFDNLFHQWYLVDVLWLQEEIMLTKCPFYHMQKIYVWVLCCLVVILKNDVAFCCFLYIPHVWCIKFLLCMFEVFLSESWHDQFKELDKSRIVVLEGSRVWWWRTLSMATAARWREPLKKSWKSAGGWKFYSSYRNHFSNALNTGETKYCSSFIPNCGRLWRETTTTWEKKASRDGKADWVGCLWGVFGDLLFLFVCVPLFNTWWCICVVRFIFVEQSSSHTWGILHDNRRK